MNFEKFALYPFRNAKGRVLYNHQRPLQWPNGSALKTGRREVPGSIPGRAYRRNLSVRSVAFSETCVNAV